MYIGLGLNQHCPQATAHWDFCSYSCPMRRILFWDLIYSDVTGIVNIVIFAAYSSWCAVYFEMCGQRWVLLNFLSIISNDNLFFRPNVQAMPDIKWTLYCLDFSGNTADTKGTAFVVYEDIFDAKNACDHLSGFNVCNRYLVVLYYQSNKVSQQIFFFYVRTFLS